MKAFCIDSENNITALAALHAAPAGAEIFTTSRELAKLTAEWPIARLVEIWNGFAGVPPFGDLKPVKKFENRMKAAGRIWEAIQKIEAPSPRQTTAARQPAPEREEMPKAARQSRRVATAQQPARKPRGPAAEGPGGKKAQVITMLGVEGGATLKAIMEATGWQAHTVRGFMAGALGTKMGLTVTSFKNAAGERTYSLPPSAVAKALAQRA